MYFEKTKKQRNNKKRKQQKRKKHTKQVDEQLRKHTSEMEAHLRFASLFVWMSICGRSCFIQGVLHLDGTCLFWYLLVAFSVSAVALR